MEEWICNNSSDWAGFQWGPTGPETFTSWGLAGGEWPEDELGGEVMIELEHRIPSTGV